MASEESSPTLLTELYRRLAEKNAEESNRNREPRDRFWISELGKCRRQVYHQRRGDRQEPMDVKGKLRTLGGTFWHDSIRRTMLELGVPITGIAVDGVKIRETKVERDFEINGTKFKITGYSDGFSEGTYLIRANAKIPENFTVRPGQLIEANDIFDIAVVEGDTVIEFKTYQDWPYRKFKQAPDRVAYLKEQYAPYWIQCHLLAGFFNRTRIMLVPINMNDGTVGFLARGGKPEGVLFDFDQGVYNEALERAAYIQHHLNINTPPPPDFLDGTWQCRYCPVYDHCHGMNK